MAVELFVTKTLDLISKERDAEIAETRDLTQRLSAKELQRRGICLLKLEIKSRRSGLYGRMVLVFGSQLGPGAKQVKVELPSHNFTPGDIVGLGLMKSQATDKPLATGLVSQVNACEICVAFDDSEDVLELDDDEAYKLTKLANDVTYRRLKMVLNDLSNSRGGPSQRLIDTLFGLEEVSPSGAEFSITFVNENLDESQKEAVKFALTQKEVAIIHGPPGTGKTTTVVELIIQAVKQGLKVLATAPSNIAVDNLVERLPLYKQRIVRVGHPARLLAHLQKYSLDAIISGSDHTDVVEDVKSDIHKVLNKLKKTKNKGEKRALRDEMKLLKKEATQREEAATKDILSRADVVLVTLTSASRDGPLKYLKEDHFDLVVIDECSQALEAACWIGLLRARRCVLAGDHKQLPPTILSKESAAAGLELTLMERLLKTLSEEKGKDVVRMLTTQYRMHQDIMEWASQQLYQGRLVAHPSVASHLLSDLVGVSDDEETTSPLLIIDTAGCDLYELDLPEEVSKGNEGEADIVASHVDDLVKRGVKPADIAVIAPYNLQVDLIRLRLSSKYPSLEVKSVDGFQGREKEAVIISMVRSNPTGEVGFLAEKRRINVAVTRARRHLTVVCDTETVCHDNFIKSLVDYMTEKGDVQSAHQYIQDGRAHQTFSKSATDTHKVVSRNEEKQVAHKKHVSSQHSLQSKEEKLIVYRKQLEAFKADSTQSVLDFPVTLTSHDRMVIHEVAEQLSLYHASIGEEKNRHIRVSKMKIDLPLSNSCGDNDHIDKNRTEQVAEITPAAQLELSSTKELAYEKDLKSSPDVQDISNKVEKQQEKNPDTELTNKKQKLKVKINKQTEKGRQSQNSVTELPDNCAIDDDIKQCCHCQKNIRIANLALHELHCSRLKKTKDINTEGGEKISEQGGAKKKEVKATEKKKPPMKSQTHKVAEVLGKIDPNDFEGLIASITELDSKCAFRKCKTLTNTLGRNCEHCTRRFCLTHLMPEVHGCGDAAKEAARRVISREGVLHSGSGVPNKKPNPARRAQLELKLEKKIGDLTNKRSKNTEKKKS
ncbi:DNA-binding protein SMUBP-2 [Biomphalaria pfeifferi]|uniref:DNA-binding protein SMUBP-2 n=1 Tax=Biomphalaria pfeifferi TaxID=112525 RepID=A0AAD8EWQ1_BIOPF|nr:DNA-binding protein SMUBP-2 [Biomphalaria pfeifferi]